VKGRPERGQHSRKTEQVARILIVEDEVFLRYVLAECLRDKGHEVVEAVSGDEATTVLSSIMMVDLVITDVQMPGSLSGLQLARNIRTAFPSLPVIVVSGQPRPATFDEVGAAAFFLKPYDFDELTARVAALTPRVIAPDEKRRSAGE
jgi:CheY-like chemotaxis protein